jgi:hypothetical protein
MVTRCDRAYAFPMANGGGVVATGLLLGVALWVPVAHNSGTGGSQYNYNPPAHHSAPYNQHYPSGQAHHQHPAPTVKYYLRPSDIARLAHHSDAVFEAKILSAHARMYRGSPQPYRLFSFKPLAMITGNVNPRRQIWQSTTGNSAQTRIEVGHTYLLATHNTPNSPYLVLRGPRAVTQIR